MDYRLGIKNYSDLQFDLAICDIPYGLDVANMAYLRETKTTVKQKNGSRLNGNLNKEVYTKKDWDSSPPPQEYFDELKRVSKHQIIFGVEYVDWEGLGQGRIKWNKGVPEGMSFKSYEMAYCSLIEEEVQLDLLWAGMCQAKSLWEPMTQQGNKKLNEKRLHPCYKPTLLYQKLIMDYGFKGCSILDTHVGGGAIRKAAHTLECDFEGYEIDQEYWKKQEDSFNKFLDLEQLQTKLF